MSDPGLNDEALGAWLDANLAGFSRPFSLTKFSSGQSNPTYRIDASSGAYVLRRKPFGQLLPSAHAVDREYRLLSALSPLDFPVPKPLALCTDPEVIGAIFYVMELAEGRPYADGSLPDFTPDLRRTMYLAMIDTLADLHGIDPETAGLGDFGKPGNYFERQVARWSRQYRDSQTDDIREMERLIEYLPASLPVQSRNSIVHGDYRIDNLIYAKDRPEVLAVLDWELSTLGDPLADFTYVAMAWVTENGGRSGVMDLDRMGLGIPELDEMVERYCAATGRDGVPDMNWYFAYNFFRLAGILQGIKKRVIDDTASSQHAKDMSERVRPLAEKAWAFARTAGA